MPIVLILIPIITAVVAICLFVFWIKMIIHAATKNNTHKIEWLLVVVLLGVVGGLIYYFVVKQKSTEPTQTPSEPANSTASSAPIQ